MPLPYLAIHLLLAALCLCVGLRRWGPRPIRLLLGTGVLLLAAAGLLLERRTDLSWALMALSWPDAVYFTNLSLPAVAVLAAALWSQAETRGARVRAGVLSVLAAGAALWSHAWLFYPAPSGLAGRADAAGFCRQTTEDSCSAAAAVMVLHRQGIPATEAEMARLCLTRARLGTPPLGLYRGLALKAAPHGMKARLTRVSGPGELSRLGGPAILSVGLPPGAPPAVVQRMEQYGWQPGVRHAVVVLEADPAGAWLEIADPSYGRERWPTQDLDVLWDGRALHLVRP